MPRHEFENYYSHEELAKLVALLDAFASDYSRWHLTTARKRHEDIFGEIIKPGEDYYKSQRAGGFHEVIKLSSLSMERLCFVLFESTFTLKPIAEHILKQRQDAFMAKIKNFKFPGSH